MKLCMSSVSCMYVCICTICLGVWGLEFALLMIFYSENTWKASIAFSPLYIGATSIWQRMSPTKGSLFKLDYAIAFLFDLLSDELWNVKLGVDTMQESFWNSIFFLRNIKVRIICTGVGKTLSSWEETLGAGSREQLLEVPVLGPRDQVEGVRWEPCACSPHGQQGLSWGSKHPVVLPDVFFQLFSVCRPRISGIFSVSNSDFLQFHHQLGCSLLRRRRIKNCH